MARQNSLVDVPVPLPTLQRTGVNQHSPAQAKIALLRSLFHGREDVYPRRFESRNTGRAGYSPRRRAAEKLVRAVILSEAKNLALSRFKSRIKCSGCAHQRFPPVPGRGRGYVSRSSLGYHPAGNLAPKRENLTMTKSPFMSEHGRARPRHGSHQTARLDSGRMYR